MSKVNKVIVHETSDYCEALKHCFGKENIIYLKEEEDIKILEKISKEIEEETNIIFFNLTKTNYLLLNMLPKKVNISVIFEYSVSEFSDFDKSSEALLILKYMEIGIIKNVYCLNKATYQIFEPKYKFKYIQLDIDEQEKCPGETIGIIAESDDYYSGIVNELSAITFTDYREVRLYNPIKPVRKFCKDFNIKMIKEKSMRDVISNNEINLYVNFCGISYPLILESMDKGIPCIVGNTDFFDSNEILKKHLVMKSDDDINEIKDKILEVKKNKKLILNEYTKFRKKYSKSVKESLKSINADLL
ncbi:MAG: hypothetical protein HFE81_04975 [Bacilli bacterium]|nr:hypothetical protein [Bacilli bacterium]